MGTGSLYGGWTGGVGLLIEFEIDGGQGEARNEATSTEEFLSPIVRAYEGERGP